MKHGLVYAVLAAFLCTGCTGLTAEGQFDMDGVRKALMGDALTETEIARGLKEALQIGTDNAVAQVSGLDGYYRNPDIRILLPENVRQTESLLRTIGLGRQVDDFLLSMNRAAEQAAPAATDIFLAAIGSMTIQDARRILDGADDAATVYFREKTGDRLLKTFQPIARDAMDQVGVTRTYQQIADAMAGLPMSDSVPIDLDRYVAENALDGLFFMLAAEEKKIREDPAARVTELLKRVFGGNA